MSDTAGARTAEAQGAKALAVDRLVEGLRGSTTLPVLLLPGAGHGDGDAVAIRPGGDEVDGLELVMEVRDEDELEEALESHDPEIVLISPHDDDEVDALALALELLPDVPAGKLAIADVAVGDRAEVLELERAGFDAVLVAPGHIEALVGVAHPAV